MFRGFVVSWFHGFVVSWFHPIHLWDIEKTSGFMVSWFRGFMVSSNPSLGHWEDVRLHGFVVSWFHPINLSYKGGCRLWTFGQLQQVSWWFWLADHSAHLWHSSVASQNEHKGKGCLPFSTVVFNAAILINDDHPRFFGLDLYNVSPRKNIYVNCYMNLLS